MKGWLEVQKGVEDWKRRFFYIEGRNLCYTKARDGLFELDELARTGTAAGSGGRLFRHQLPSFLPLTGDGYAPCGASLPFCIPTGARTRCAFRVICP